MAENKNLDELNMLQNDGKIDSTQARQEDRKDVEAVARGKKTIEDAPQAVTVELLKEYSNQNKVFAKLEVHCDQDGVDIYAYFMRCFRDNETVRVSDILDDIAKRIPTLIDVINDDKNNNLFIDGNGNIDVAGALKKARDNGRELPSYIQAIAQDAGKDEVENNVIVNYPLTTERKEEYIQFKKDAVEAINRLNSNKDYQDLANKINQMDSGNATGEKVPKELYIVKKLLDDTDIFVDKFDVPDDIEGERILFVKSYARLRQLQGIDISKLPPYLVEGIQLRIDLMQKALLKTHVVEKIEEITPEKLEEILKQKVTLKDKDGNDIKKSLSEMYHEETAKLEGIISDAEKNYDSINLTEKDIREKLEQNYSSVVSNEDFKNSLNFLRILPYVKQLENGQQIDLSDNFTDRFAAKFVKNDPEKLRIIKESRASFVRDDTSDIKLKVLKRKCFEEVFENYKVQDEDVLKFSPNPEKREKAILAREMTLVRYAIEFSKNEKQLYSIDDQKMQVKARDVITDILSKDVLDSSGHIDYEKVLIAYKEKFGQFSAASKLNTVDDLIRDSEKTTTNVLRAKIVSEMIGADKSRVLGKSKVTEIANSKEFIEEVSEKCNKRRALDFDYKFKASIISRFLERKKDVDNKLKDPAILYDLVRQAGLILTWKDFKNTSMDQPIFEMATQVIAERLPGALTNGEIDFEKFGVEYGKFASQKRQEAGLPPVVYDKDPLKEEFKYIESLEKEFYFREKLKQSPEEWKKHNDEIREQAQKNRKIIKGREEKAVYEFIDVVTRGRSGKNSDILQPETTEKFSELLKRVDKRLQNRIGDEANYKVYTESVRNAEPDPKAFKAFAREAKLTFVRADANDLIEIIATKKTEVTESERNEAVKKVFEYYIGTKRDLDESPVTDNDNTHKVRRINYLMKKVATEAFENGKVNEEKLLLKYNEVFGTNIENVDDMFQTVEDKLLGKYAGKLIEAIDKGEGYNGEYAHPLVGRNFFRRINEEKLAEKASKSHKITDKEMQRVMERQVEEIVVDPTVLHKTNDGKRAEGKDSVDSQVISGKDIEAAFERKAVELGGEEPKKVEQHVDVQPKNLQAESVEVDSNEFGKNLPVEQPKKGFLSNIFNSIKNGIKKVKEKIFGVTDNNTGTGTTDNNNVTGTTSGTGGVNKDEQDLVNLTGHGKINLTFGTPATVSEDDKKTKSVDGVGRIEPEGEEK